MKFKTRIQEDLFVGFIATFLINLIVFTIAIAFSDIRFLQCLFYSFINAIWMTLFLLPIVMKDFSLFKKKMKENK